MVISPFSTTFIGGSLFLASDQKKNIIFSWFFLAACTCLGWLITSSFGLSRWLQGPNSQENSSSPHSFKRQNDLKHFLVLNLDMLLHQLCEFQLPIYCFLSYFSMNLSVKLSLLSIQGSYKNRYKDFHCNYSESFWAPLRIMSTWSFGYYAQYLSNYRKTCFSLKSWQFVQRSILTTWLWLGCCWIK